jgi:hypothetical protein
MTESPHPEAPEEQDSRFPSGPWKGFFLQPGAPDRHWMELNLSFRQAELRGEGRDEVGAFLVRGRYDLTDGKCWWTKRYIGRHDISYSGFNEGKGIWGTWVWDERLCPTWRGGFHIWPAAMGDPTRQTLTEALDVPAFDDLTVAPLEEATVGVAAP